MRLEVLLCIGVVALAKQIIPTRLLARAIGCAGLILPFSSDAIEQQYKLPPIDRKDVNRCQFVDSAMGQANAARDKLLDLRECDMKGKSAAGKDLSGIIGENSNFEGTSFKEAQLSKGLLRKSNFKKCDFTNGVVDRVTFEGSDLEGAIFVNAVLSGASFTNANLKDTDFTDAYLGRLFTY